MLQQQCVPGACRVCVVNSAGNVLLDEHVAQKERVTDYRTRFSGIRPRDLVGAPSLEEVQQRVADMFKGRIVVGHAITNDLTVSMQDGMLWRSAFCWDAWGGRDGCQGDHMAGALVWPPCMALC